LPFALPAQRHAHPRAITAAANQPDPISSTACYRRTVEGFWLRASKRRVPMCPACAAAVWERREKAARLKAALLIAAGALVLGLLFAA
jgi:hypothetical protein